MRPDAMRSLNVTYILLRFPVLTETFVAEEINALRAQGVDVTIVSLLEPRPGPAQPLSRRLVSQTWYAPGFLEGRLWVAQLRVFRRQPLLYLSLLMRLLRQPWGRRPLSLSAKRLAIFLKAVAVADHLRGSSTQMLHSHFAWLSGAAAFVVARFLRLPFTVTVHAYDIYAYDDLLGLVCREADHVVAISDFNRRYATAAARCDVDAMSVIHCGVDLERLKCPATAAPPRPVGRPLRILSVGSLVPKKGHTHLIEACRVLKERGVAFTCTIIGGGPDESRLATQIRDYGLQSCVTLRGACPHPEIVMAYHEHDLFVLASVVAPGGDRDGIPVVLMEAAAVGLPMIATAISGIPELVRHNETGWLVPEADATALAHAIITLGADATLRERLGQNARALVEAEFSIDNSAARLAGLFRRVRGGEGPDLSGAYSLQKGGA